MFKALQTAAALLAMTTAGAASAATLYAGNGHLYDFVATDLTWQGALAAAAAAAPIAGYAAHLVTITDAGEDAFVQGPIGQCRLCLGGGYRRGGRGHMEVGGRPGGGANLLHPRWSGRRLFALECRRAEQQRRGELPPHPRPTPATGTTSSETTRAAAMSSNTARTQPFPNRQPGALMIGGFGIVGAIRRRQQRLIA